MALFGVYSLLTDVKAGQNRGHYDVHRIITKNLTDTGTMAKAKNKIAWILGFAFLAREIEKSSRVE